MANGPTRSITSNGGSGFDAVVVGAGHNGLACAAYLARGGLRVCVLERRDVMGGACVTEEVWPGYRVSRGASVAPMLQPKVVRDLQLHRFGYEPIAVDPPCATMGPGARPLFFFGHPAATQESIKPHSTKDAAAFPEFEAMLAGLAGFVRPLLLRPPPALGSRRPGDVFSLVREAGRAAGLGQRDLQELYRLMTMSAGDVLDEWFESDVIKGALAASAVAGLWAGPRSAGTAYGLLRRALAGPKAGRGRVKGGVGAVAQALARSAVSAGATIRTGAPVRSIDVRDGRTTGVTLESGEQLHAPLVVSGAHPRTTILEMVGAEHLPDDVVRDMRRYRSRGGSVKVNCVLSEPPRHLGAGEADQQRLLHASLLICPSLDYLERAWQDAVRGSPAERPAIEVEVSTAVDPSLADDGATVLTMLAHYGPYDEAAWDDGARVAYGQRCLEMLGEHAPNVPAALVHGEVLAPPDLERTFGLVGGSIYQGEEGLDQQAFMRPSPQLSQYATPVDGLYLCGAGTHPGGGVTAAGGHNAAQRILRDRTPLRRRLRRPGLLAN